MSRCTRCAASCSKQLVNVPACRRTILAGWRQRPHRGCQLVVRQSITRSLPNSEITSGPNIDEGYKSAGGKYYIRLLKGEDMHVVANIQAESFHTPIAFNLLDDVAKHNFRAEVLDALRNKLQNNPIDSFAIFVAVPVEAGPGGAPVAVLELFLSDEPEVMQHLPTDSFSPARSLRKKGYAWLSSMAVAESERRKGCATALLDAAHLVADRWNYGYAALHVHHDNEAGIALYEKNGYQCVEIDPAWRTAFGFKRRVLMLRQLDVE